MTVLVFCFSVVMTIAGIGLAGLSIYLSVDVFSGIGQEGTIYTGIFGSMAFAFEIIKFSLIPIALHFSNSKNKREVALSYGLGVTFLLLSFLSVFSSVSSLNQNNKKYENEYIESISTLSEKDEEISQLEIEINQLNSQVDIFIKAEKLTLKANPTAAKRDLKKAELKILKEERDAIVIPERTAMAEGADMVGQKLGLDSSTAAVWVNLIAGLMIDFLAAVGLFTGEVLFKSLTSSKEKSKKDKDQRNADEREKDRKHEREMMRLKNLGSIPKEEPAPTVAAPIPASRASPTLVASSPEITSAGGDQDVDAARLKEVKTLMAKGELPDPPNARQIAQKIGANSAEARKLEGYLKRG